MQSVYAQESYDIKDRVTSYWGRRAGSFADHKHDEVHSYKAKLWLDELIPQLPAGGDNIRILDVGCGAGFFEMLLAPAGYDITGIDLTPEMISQAKQLAGSHHAGRAEFYVMDAENPDFPDEYFDAVISRNLTWTLPLPGKAYREWHRVLKSGGVLLNYDAEYAKGAQMYDQAENLAHVNIDKALSDECCKIYDMLKVSTYERPAWDREVLSRIGFSDISIDTDAGDRLYGIRDQFYMPDRMFRIRAVK